MYEHARHSYKLFGQLEHSNYVNLLSELKILVMKNIQKKPGFAKHAGTPVHNKPVNRPRKRLGSSHSVRFLSVLRKLILTFQTIYTGTTGSSTTIIQRNASTVLVSTESNVNNSTRV